MGGLRNLNQAVARNRRLQDVGSRLWGAISQFVDSHPQVLGVFTNFGTAEAAGFSKQDVAELGWQIAAELWVYLSQRRLRTGTAMSTSLSGPSWLLLEM